MSAATAGYGVFAAIKPDHLGDALQIPAHQASGYRLLASTYAGRDLAISTTGLLARSERVVTTAMALRIAMDVVDCIVLASTTSNPQVRRKVVAVTLTWAALNTAALLRDRSLS